MPTTYRDGPATIIVDDDALRRHLESVPALAVRSFIRETSAILDPLKTAVEASSSPWPVRTGRSKRSMQRVADLADDRVTNRLENTATSGRWGYYAFRVRWSVRLQSSLDAEAERAGQRGLTPATRESLRANWRRILTRRHGLGAPSEALAGKQPWRVMVRTPARRQEAAMFERLQADLSTLAGAD